MEKRGQVNALPNSIIILGVALISLFMIIVVIQEVRDTDVVAASRTGSFVNDTMTTVTEVGEDLTVSKWPACAATVSVVYNQSVVIIGSGNYTVTGCTIAFSSAGAQDILNFNNTDWNITGTYTSGDESWTASNQSLEGMGTFGDFWVIIVLAVVAAIVVGLIFNLFSGTRRR